MLFHSIDNERLEFFKEKLLDFMKSYVIMLEDRKYKIKFV